MTQYNMLNVKLYNSQFSKLKSRIKNSAKLPHKLLLTNTKVS